MRRLSSIKPGPDGVSCLTSSFTAAEDPIAGAPPSPADNASGLVLKSPDSEMAGAEAAVLDAEVTVEAPASILVVMDIVVAVVLTASETVVSAAQVVVAAVGMQVVVLLIL